MDHSFPIGATRHHHHSAGNSQQFRVSPVNFQQTTSRTSQNPNTNGSQQFNSLQQLFPSASIPPSIFRGNANNYLNPSAAPNHFNFPLRSNTMSNRPGYGNGNVTGGANNFNRNGGSGSGRNQTQSQTMNKVRLQQSSQQNSGSGNGNSMNQSTTKVSPNNQSQCNDTTTQPQYRIFKRGDSIPGISSPISVITPGNNTADNGENSSNIEVSPPRVNNGNGDSSGSGGKSQDKENNAVRTDSTDNTGPKTPNQPNKTPVSIVSDIARFHNLTVEYRLISEKGPPHNPIFTVVLHIGDKEEYTGNGSSIKRAQHAAAAEAIEKTSLSRPTPRSQPKRPFGPTGKRPNWALIQLTSLAEDLKEPISIVQQPITIIDPFRRGDPPSVVSIHVGDRIFTGEGNNFNSAKNLAAMIALKAMIKVKQEIEMKLNENGGGLEDGSMENKSPISVVHEMAMKRGLAVKFEVVREEGPPHRRQFTVLCSAEEHSAEGQGPTKQAAKKAASELMIEKLNGISLPSPNLQVGSMKSIQRGLFRQKMPRKKTSAPVVKDLEKQTVSPISRLIQIAHIRKYKEPEFILVASSSGATEDPNLLKAMSERERRNIRKKKPSFTMEVVVGPHACRGIGSNKKAAKKAAAEAALVEFGYGPPETPNQKEGTEVGASNKSSKHASNSKSKSMENGKTSNGQGITSARQIVPGVIVLNNENKEHAGGSPIKSSAEVAQEMVKVDSMSSGSSGPSFRDGTEKLAYLARLLDVPVSYSDFPKKNEFLSVVSLGTNPPHVAHGCGGTLEDAQNAAATKILSELQDIGIDNVKSECDSDSKNFLDNPV